MKTITEKEYLDALGIVRSYLSQIKKELKIEDAHSIFERNIRDFGLSTRAHSGLKYSCGVKTIRDLVSLEEGDLKNKRLMGKKTIAEINEFMMENHLSFGMLKEN